MTHYKGKATFALGLLLFLAQAGWTQPLTVPIQAQAPEDTEGGKPPGLALPPPLESRLVSPGRQRYQS